MSVWSKLPRPEASDPLPHLCFRDVEFESTNLKRRQKAALTRGGHLPFARIL